MTKNKFNLVLNLILNLKSSIAIKMDNVGMNGDKVNNEKGRGLERRIGNFGAGFDDEDYGDDLI